MLKKIAIACAGFVLTGQSALFAQTANPLDVPSTPPQPVVLAPASPMVFLGEIDGIPVVLQLTVTGQDASGFLIVGDQKCPFSGKTEGPVIDGSWQAASGKTYRLRITDRRDSLTLETNGKTLSLRPANRPVTNPPVTAPPATQPLNQNNVPFPAPKPQDKVLPLTDASLDNVSDKVGEHFTAPLPAGWRMMDGPLGAFIGSADGKSGFGVIGRPLEETEGFSTFGGNMLKAVGVSDPTVLSTVELKVDGGEGRELVLGFVGRDNVKRTGIFRIVVLNNGPRKIGMIWHAATPDDQFRAECGKMLKLAMAIRMNAQQPTPAPLPPQAPQANGGNENGNPLNF
ncbi:hypothetical protein [Humisphaera borealis]|uniref:Uncharacterized protein n=1 Tax=Humisphaera borealis TaxID=2807512 RepID=A0A7M2WU44_9BACT|nr:hypothetical protein [Humisphaera borealis]QOV89045.1 hypothetical protein IPV69_22930 [Humisphaera borealis]